MKAPFKIISVFIAPELGFKGNTSAVVKLDKPKAAEYMQQVAADLNQPATTFLWKQNDKLKVRWFAPDDEIGLCGHGTLAALAFIDQEKEIELHYNDGVISGNKYSDNRYVMALGAISSSEAGNPDQAIVKGLSTDIKGYFSNKNKNIVLLSDETTIRQLKPDFGILKNMNPFGIIVTAPGDNVDFVSRTFVPKVQQLEDHATGSSHAALIPFWASKLGKTKMTAYQLSPRGGKFVCELNGDKVLLSGEARTVAEGFLPIS
jgi:predicted PhzF superfamily epimerase YddE/YHI9